MDYNKKWRTLIDFLRLLEICCNFYNLPRKGDILESRHRGQRTVDPDSSFAAFDSRTVVVAVADDEKYSDAAVASDAFAEVDKAVDFLPVLSDPEPSVCTSFLAGIASWMSMR